MKKTTLLTVLLIFTATILFADTTESDLYYKSRPITKIYVTQYGYRIVYQLSDLKLADFYVPMSWFDPTVGKAILITGDSTSYPYFSIFWKNDKFDFIKIYVRSNTSDPSWGSTYGNVDPSKYNVTTLNLKWQ